MYSTEIIIENIQNEKMENERVIESNNSHYCFDVITENNNNRLVVSLVCYLSFMGGFMYVFLDHMINRATI